MVMSSLNGKRFNLVFSLSMSLNQFKSIKKYPKISELKYASSRMDLQNRDVEENLLKIPCSFKT